MNKMNNNEIDEDEKELTNFRKNNAHPKLISMNSLRIQHNKLHSNIGHSSVRPSEFDAGFTNSR